MDGWIGDPAHAARVSDHNPDERGIVRALDVTAKGVDPHRIVRAAVHHPATHYVIYDGWIYERHRDFYPVQYSGTDPHESHVHISIMADARSAASDAPWDFDAS